MAALGAFTTRYTTLDATIEIASTSAPVSYVSFFCFVDEK